MYRSDIWKVASGDGIFIRSIFPPTISNSFGFVFQFVRVLCTKAFAVCRAPASTCCPKRCSMVERIYWAIPHFWAAFNYELFAGPWCLVRQCIAYSGGKCCQRQFSIIIIEMSSSLIRWRYQLCAGSLEQQRQWQKLSYLTRKYLGACKCDVDDVHICFVLKISIAVYFDFMKLLLLHVPPIELN